MENKLVSHSPKDTFGNLQCMCVYSKRLQPLASGKSTPAVTVIKTLMQRLFNRLKKKNQSIYRLPILSTLGKGQRAASFNSGESCIPSLRAARAQARQTTRTHYSSPTSLDFAPGGPRSEGWTTAQSQRSGRGPCDHPAPAPRHPGGGVHLPGRGRGRPRVARAPPF